MTGEKRTYSGHKEYLEQEGYTMASPVTGSMRPMIRPDRDVVVLRRIDRPLRRYDVVAYLRGDRTILHRIIGVKEEGAQRSYLIRGDAESAVEEVPQERIFGLMEGLYRGERYVSCDNRLYQAASRVMVAVNPVIRLRRRVGRWLKKAAGEQKA